MGRIQGLTEAFLNGTYQVVKSSEGYVFSITLSYKGATAGDIVRLRDGLDGTGAAEVEFTLPAAHGTLTKEWPQGKHFATGIVYDPTVTGGGTAKAEITYK
jgi:hypothetical protein